MKNDHSNAAATFIDQNNAFANLVATRNELESIAREDFPRLACLFGLLEEQKAIADDSTLSGACYAIRELLDQVWERVEAAASRLDC
jgi:4-diphosphocytidyl-2C-methyl-D-erythritol kinase